MVIIFEKEKFLEKVTLENNLIFEVGLVFRGLTPQQQPGSYQGGEMMMKSVFWWRKFLR